MLIIVPLPGLSVRRLEVDPARFSISFSKLDLDIRRKTLSDILRTELLHQMRYLNPAENLQTEKPRIKQQQSSLTSSHTRK